MAQRAPPGTGTALARSALSDGRAWRKFQAIAEAQGGLRELKVAPRRHAVEATVAGTVASIDSRRLSRVAKLAGAPNDAVAGVDLHVRIGAHVNAGQPLYTLHAQSPGELEYALDYAHAQPDIIAVVAP
jgi:thymidine phosphorylase